MDDFRILMSACWYVGNEDRFVWFARFTDVWVRSWIGIGHGGV